MSSLVEHPQKQKRLTQQSLVWKTIEISLEFNLISIRFSSLTGGSVGPEAY
jgi:hypothetical protein